jgi:large subunit ribosomal protein L17
MRHNVDGRKFGRNTSHRKAMFRNMANSVILEEQVVTTLQKAKEVRRVVDSLITIAKGNSPQSGRLLFDRTRDERVVHKVLADLAPRFSARSGGYTRVLKVADRRWGDAAELAVLELVDRKETSKGKLKKSTDAGSGKSESNVDSTGQSAPTSNVDPFKRFRRLFQQKRATTSNS